jgi:hypothetical protein
VDQLVDVGSLHVLSWSYSDVEVVRLDGQILLDLHGIIGIIKLHVKVLKNHCEDEHRLLPGERPSNTCSLAISERLRPSVTVDRY